jgi:hypothetical protein
MQRLKRCNQAINPRLMPVVNQRPTVSDSDLPSRSARSVGQRWQAEYQLGVETVGLN